MNSLTKEQLTIVLTEYYKQNKETPEEFSQYSDDPAEDAINTAEYVFEIAAQQSKGE
jgi:HEPN domain-containing protein